MASTTDNSGIFIYHAAEKYICNLVGVKFVGREKLQYKKLLADAVNDCC